MSWLRSALNKASEIGGKSLPPAILRTGRSFAGSVYQTTGHAIAGGAKIVQDRLSGRRYNDFKHAVRKLDEVALNARGEERYQALARWLGALKDINREAERAASSERRASGTDYAEVDEEGSSPQPSRASLVLFYDSDISNESLTFRDVFLRSHALENIVTSLIYEAPEEEEVSMVLEMFGLCLAGGPELHQAIMSGIQDLSKANSSYTEEVMMKRQVLLQMSRDCISGLKLSSEAERLETDILQFQQQIAVKKASPKAEETLSLGQRAKTAEELFWLGKSLHDCLVRKAAALKAGDTQETHAEKVERMKDLTTKLSGEIQAMKKKISDNKQQKQDSIKYRTTKAQEVAEAEKVISQEVQALEKRREQLEAELKEVKAQIKVSTAKHIHIQEEKEQFDEASSNIIAHLAIQDNDLTHKVAAHTVEVSTIATWQSFLEDTWLLQSNCMEEREKAMKSSLDVSEKELLSLTQAHVTSRQEELEELLGRLKAALEEIEKLKSKTASGDSGAANVSSENTVALRKAEENYLEVEAKIKSLLLAATKAKDELEIVLRETADTGSAKSIQESFDAIFSLQKQFEEVERPKLLLEEPPPPPENPFKRKSLESLKSALTSGSFTSGQSKPATPTGVPHEETVESDVVEKAAAGKAGGFKSTIGVKGGSRVDPKKVLDEDSDARKDGVGADLPKKIGETDEGGGDGWDLDESDDKVKEKKETGDGDDSDGDVTTVDGYLDEESCNGSRAVRGRHMSRQGRNLEEMR
eukprot:TRINITY_DN1577_c0_g1_i1.p1 TRINITY_DN1577_c0_g1~~TRINITY_DN1577_c0_g1_i1.p1  ORF type:complete len:757 (-),score=221.17 TRINITY_DN1577_c0_g1_i1:983-3253(-)